MHGFAADLYAFGVLLVMMLTGGEVVEFPVEIGFPNVFSCTFPQINIDPENSQSWVESNFRIPISQGLFYLGGWYYHKEYDDYNLVWGMPEAHVHGW